ncbi:MAG: hypothetical protein AB7O26_18815, partial [Planctomycetaceae bacterium]
MISFVRLDHDALRTHLELACDVSGGGLRKFDVSLPESAGTNVRFVVLDGKARILEQRAQDPANGERVWTLRFDRPLDGKHRLGLDLEQPRGELQQFQPPAVKVTTADRQNGYIVVEADSEQRLTLAATGPDNLPLSEVDPIDLPEATYRPQQRIVGAYRNTTANYQLSISEQRFDRLGVPSAICRQAEILSVLGRTGEFQHRAYFRFAAAGVQSLRIRLPESAELWSTLVDGVPVEARKVEGASSIPLPAGGKPDAERQLVVVYHTHSEPLDAVGRIQQQVPAVSIVTGSGELQPLEVLDRIWRVSYPRETSILESDGAFVPEGSLDRASLLGRFSQSFRIPTTRELLWGLLWLAVASAVVLFLMKNYERGGFRRIALAIIVTGCCALMVMIVMTLPVVEQKKSERAPQSETATHAYHPPAMGDVTVEPPAEAVRTDGIPNRPKAGVPIINKVPHISRLDESAPAKSAPPDSESRVRNRINVAPTGEPKEQLNHTFMSGGPLPSATGGNQGGGGFGGGFGGGVQDELPRQGTTAGMNAPQRGRLSLSVDVLAPPDSAEKVFRNRSAGSSGESPTLDVLYENRSAGAAYRLAVAVAIICAMWFTRKAARSKRLVAALLGVVIPLALVPVVPVAWQIWLDGLFLGTIGGVVLWLATAAAVSIRESFVLLHPVGPSQITRAVSLAILLFAADRSAHAQQPPNAPAVQRNAEPMARPAPTLIQSLPAPPGRDDQIEIVIPYDRNTDPLAAERVHVPYDAFLKLWNQAYPEKRIGGAAALDGAVSGVLYQAELQPAVGDAKPRVSVKGRIIVTSFRERQITLPLPLRDIAIRSATLDGETAALIVPAKPGPKIPEPLRVVVDKPGTHVLDIEFDIAAESSGPAGRFTMPLLPVAAGRLVFTLPAPNLTARVNGSSSAFRLKKAENREQIELPVDGGGDVGISWQPKEERGGVATTIHAEGTTFVDVQDSGIRYTHSFLFRARQGSVSEFVFDLPAETQLQRINGADVGGWEVSGEENSRKLRVFLRRSVSDETRITAETYQALKIADDPVSFSLPGLAPTGVTRETGTVALYAGKQLRVQGVTDTGASRINLNEFTPPVEVTVPGPAPTLVYRYSARPVQLQWQITREKPELTAVAEHGVLVERRKQRITSSFQVTLTGAPRSRISFTLPPNYLPMDVNAQGMRDWFLTGDGDAKTLTIEFDQPRTGATMALVSGTIARDVSDDTADVVLPSLQDASKLESTLA